MTHSVLLFWAVWDQFYSKIIIIKQICGQPRQGLLAAKFCDDHIVYVANHVLHPIKIIYKNWKQHENHELVRTSSIYKYNTRGEYNDVKWQIPSIFIVWYDWWSQSRLSSMNSNGFRHVVTCQDFARARNSNEMKKSKSKELESILFHNWNNFAYIH